MSLQRDRPRGRRRREAPPRLHDRPEDDGEEEAPREQRDRVAALHLVLGEQEVHGEDHGRDQREGDAEAVERDAAPELHHQRQAGEREREREPDAAAHVLVPERPRPDRDEKRAEVLDQERDADLQPVDGEEVEELDERDADDAEEGEPGELAALDAQRRARGRGRSSVSAMPAPAQRASVSRSEESPEASATFDTGPLTPKSVAATATIA